MNKRVTITFDDGVADVRLNRADKMNALDEAMLAGIAETGAQLQSMAGVRAVVLSGEGRAFCAGLDMAAFAALGTIDLVPRTHGVSNLFQHAAMMWRELPAPVIAAVRGMCLGGGLQIALGADMRIIAPDTVMSLMEIQWGLVPDMGGFVLTRGLVRNDVLRELAYTGRKVEADEAVAIGLATHLADDPHTAAMATAREIAARNPDAIRYAKALFGAIGDGETAPLLAAESAAQADILARPNQREAVMAALEKRAARFVD